jgi:acyl-CoA thioesterase
MVVISSVLKKISIKATVTTMSDSNRAITERQAAYVARAMHEQDTFTDLLGISLDDVRPGYAKVSTTVRGDMLNMHAGCHGGLIFAVADSAFGYACNSRNRASLAQFASINFLSSAKKDDILIAEAVERSITGRTGIFDVTVTTHDGRMVAEFRGVSKRIEGEVIALPEEF